MALGLPCPADFSEPWKREGRKTESRLKCEVTLVVRVSANCGVVREVILEEVTGAAIQLIMMVGRVSN